MDSCNECRFWKFEYQKILPDGKKFRIGDCRRKVPENGLYFREMFDYEWCGEFEKSIASATLKEALGADGRPIPGDRANKALSYLDERPRPPARATRAIWDEYLDTLKKILKGED